MRQVISDKEQTFRYFLGELSEREQTAIEERFFTDEDYSRFLDAAENALIADYVGGKLDFKQTLNFERRFLISKRRREKLRSAQILAAQTLTAKPATAIATSVFLRKGFKHFFRAPNLAWASSLTAIAILILFGGLWLVNSPEKNQTAKTKPENQTTVKSILPPLSENPSDLNASQKQIVRQKSKPAAKLNLVRRPKRQAAPPVESQPISAFTLLPPMQSNAKPLIVKPRDAEKIRLRVVHRNSESFSKYLVEIHASDGDLLWSREIAVNRQTVQKPLALDVRSGALASGSYELTMSGATDDGRLEEIKNFNFSVQKK
jgi:hypothetical protein